MSRPDKPAHGKSTTTGKVKQKSGKGLHDSIDELEYLIGDNDTDGLPENQQSGIPVLEDIIDPDNYTDSESGYDENPGSQSLVGTDNPDSMSDEQIAELLENVEERISGELSELVDILKDTIKDSIITELKSELKNEFRRPAEGDDDPNR